MTSMNDDAELTRREFVKTTVGLAAAVSYGTAWGASARPDRSLEHGNPLAEFRYGDVDFLPGLHQSQLEQTHGILMASSIQVANYVASTQRVSLGIPRGFGPGLFAGEREAVSRIAPSLSAYRVASLPTERQAAQDLFEFARALKIETIISDSVPQQLVTIEMVAQQYGINVALCGPYR